MKLNPEELAVSSFETSAADTDVAGAVNTPLCSILPTPCTVCIVCD